MCASYWILDPTEPGALTAFELDDEGRYREVAHVEGDEEFVATRPFPVTVVPARLLDGLRPRLNPGALGGCRRAAW